ncbi:hypothetical protein JTE90_017710 [Oedothorax gibbosus]|uniref:Uncharacterized protein n=1 Tax=Oedothorax gibbosus TaxID=931172 RepID=A0AAV6U9T1_9ARAC|nr:hypothetical protein JTE90_017710 [Oedothorax gibbosus]
MNMNPVSSLYSNEDSRRVDENYVNPEAFKTILHFLSFKQPLTYANLTAEVIRTATHLRIPQILSKIETIVHNTIGNVEFARAKNALIRDIKSQLEKSPILENPVKKPKVLIKGQTTNLKAKQMRKLNKLEYIRDKEISFFYQSILTKNIDGYLFEQLATKPHVVVEDKYGLTLKVFNVFKHNFKEAIFVDSDIYIQSMEASLRLGTEFLALG